MPKTAKAACQKCGDEMILFPRNRKYCGACQALRDLDFRPGMHRTCVYCEKEFWPSRTSHLTKGECADCAVFRIEDPDRYPACQTCGKHKRTAPGTQHTCIRCVQVSKEMQLKYHATLKRRAVVRRDLEGAAA